MADAHRNYLLGLYFGAEEKEKGQFWEEDVNCRKVNSKLATVWHFIIETDLYNHASPNTKRHWPILLLYLYKHFYFL